MRILLVVIMVLFSASVYADVFVYYDKETKEVLFIEESDTVIISDEDKGKIEKVVLPKDKEFYNLTEDYSDYKLSERKFILNTKKISDKEKNKDKDKAKRDKKNADFKSAKSKLIQLGLTEPEIDSLR